MQVKTKPDAVLQREAMQLLIDRLGLVDAQRFIANIQTEQFDYTQWQSNLWEGQSVEEIYGKAAAFYHERHPQNS